MTKRISSVPEIPEERRDELDALLVEYMDLARRERELRGGMDAAYESAVVGDVVGDPFKDVSGPSMNVLIKLMVTVALVFCPLFGKLAAQ